MALLLLLFIQVNRSPSFSTDTKLDWDIKFAVIKDTLQLLNIRCADQLNFVTYPPPLGFSRPTDRHKTLSLQKVASRKRLLHLTCKGSRIPCGQEGSLCHNRRKREELVRGGENNWEELVRGGRSKWRSW